MPAEIEKIVYAGSVPWHGLGKQVQGLLASEEAIKLAELDWEVELKPVSVMGEIRDDYRAIMRATDHEFYGIVGKRYVPIQNRAAFKFFDDIIQAKAAYIETVGSLQKGKRIWILANLGDSLSVKGDEVKKYLLLCSSHDGSLARQILWTPIRVVCNNTLQAALNTATDIFYSRHTANADSAAKKEAARMFLFRANEFYGQFETKMNIIAAKQLPASDQPLLLAAAFGTDQAIPAEDIYNPIKIQMDKVQELIEVDRGEFKPELHGTVYEAYNAVAKFTDYYRPYRGGQQENRLNGVWFGGGNIIKQRALAWAVKYSS